MPIPPSPSFPVISYGPIRCGGADITPQCKRTKLFFRVAAEIAAPKWVYTFNHRNAKDEFRVTSSSKERPWIRKNLIEGDSSKVAPQWPVWPREERGSRAARRRHLAPPPKEILRSRSP